MPPTTNCLKTKQRLILSNVTNTINHNILISKLEKFELKIRNILGYYHIFLFVISLLTTKIISRCLYVLLSGHP